MEVYQLGNKVFVYNVEMLSSRDSNEHRVMYHRVDVFIDNEQVATGIKSVDIWDDQNEAIGYAVEVVLKGLRIKNIFIDDDFIYHELLNHFGINFKG